MHNIQYDVRTYIIIITYVSLPTSEDDQIVERVMVPIDDYDVFKYSNNTGDRRSTIFIKIIYRFYSCI